MVLPIVMDKIFTCKTCSKGYKYKRSLVRHLTASGHSNAQTNSILDKEIATTIEYDLEEKSRKNYLKVITIHPKTIVIDPTVFLNNLFSDLAQLIYKNLNETQSVKFQLSLCAILYKPTTEMEIETCFNSMMQTIYGEGLTRVSFEDAKNQILKRLENFCQHGSGWTMKNISKLAINFARNRPIKAGSFIPTPTIFANNKFLLNIRTIKTNDCFELSIQAARHYRSIESHRNRPSTYRDFESIDLCGVEIPVKIKDIDKIESANKLSVNVFAMEKEVYPLRISKAEGSPVDLLLLEDDGRHHYCLITNFNGFMRRQTKNKLFYCRKCLTGCSGIDRLRNHQIVCSEQPCRIKMKQNAKMTWKNFSARMRVPFVIYADIEAITPKVVHRCNSSQTRKVEKQIPCGIYAVCLDEKGNLWRQFFDRSEECIGGFLKTARQWAREIYAAKRKFPIYRKKAGDDTKMGKATVCSICDEPLGEDRVFEHNHVNGQLRGFAHAKCNSSCRTTNFTPIIFHNGSKYDFKHILRNYRRGDDNEKLECIANNSEEFISFTICVPTGSYQNSKNERVISYEKLKFIDSFRFQAKALSSLIETMKADQLEFPTFKEVFKNLSSDQQSILLQKGVYPYSYMDSFDKFRDTELPPIWINTLTGEKLPEKDYKHAKKVWKSLGIKNMGEYHDIYLQVDVCTLADVFENFRTLAYKNFGLDPAHFLTAPHFAWDAMLKTTKVQLDLLAEKDHLDIIRRGIRGGMCGVYHSRYYKANNPKCTNFEDTKPTTWLILLDANNLYGGVMCESLPVGDFSETTLPLQSVLDTADDAEFGFFVVVDLEYPEKLHDLHNDYPLAPEHLHITTEMLSPAQAQDNWESKNICKLLQTFNTKKYYVCHYRVLKFYVTHGLRVVEVHRIIKFKQSKWMKSYIDINTEIRRKAKTDCLKDLGKLLNNSVFGKSMEDLMNRQNIKLFTDDEQCQKFISKPNFKSFTIFQPDLCALIMNKTIVTWNKPTYIGAAVLDLSKLVMYRFLYETIKPTYGEKAKLLYSDTDSLLLAIETENLYADLQEIAHEFDFSDYPKDHFLYSDKNKKKVLKMKDEMNGVAIEEYVGLRAKMYSIYSPAKEKKCAKGVTKAIQKNLHHELYKKVLKQNLTIRQNMRTLKSHNLELFVEECDKIVLNSADNKRYLADGNDTLAFGHYKIPQSSPESIVPNTLDDPTLSLDEKNFVVPENELKQSDNERKLPDPGFLSSDDSDSDFIFIPPKRMRKSPFILYEASEN